MENEKIVLKNRTVLEVGGKYRRESWHPDAHIEITQIFKEEKKARGFVKYVLSDDKELELLDLDQNDIVVFLDKKPKESFKTFLIEVLNVRKKVVYQFPILTDSIESARKLHPKALSITEIKD
jgi:hypothetical protein